MISSQTLTWSRFLIYLPCRGAATGVQAPRTEASSHGASLGRQGLPLLLLSPRRAQDLARSGRRLRSSRVLALQQEVLQPQERQGRPGKALRLLRG